MITAIFYTVVAVLIYMTGWFIAALLKKDNSIADVAWGLGFAFIAWMNLLLSNTASERQYLITILVTIWAFRLAIHICIRNKGRSEDFRYAQWRKKWGKKFIIKTFLNVFLLQGVLMILIAYPLILVNHSSTTPLNFLDFIGFLLWLLGFFFETVGDYQLLKFKKNPVNKGKIMKTGLWKYTRHPNYFGEVTIWWGIFLTSLSVPYGFSAIISPLLITFLLLKVSGIPMLEKKYQNNLEFNEYAKKTSPFFPWFPRI